MKGIHLYDQESGHQPRSFTQFHTDLSIRKKLRKKHTMLDKSDKNLPHMEMQKHTVYNDLIRIRIRNILYITI